MVNNQQTSLQLVGRRGMLEMVERSLRLMNYSAEDSRVARICKFNSRFASLSVLVTRAHRSHIDVFNLFS